MASDMESNGTYVAAERSQEWTEKQHWKDKEKNLEIKAHTHTLVNKPIFAGKS